MRTTTPCGTWSGSAGPDVVPLAAAPLHTQDLDGRLRLLDRLGIDVQVLSVSQAQPYLADAGDAAAAAAMGNDLCLAVADEHPDHGRFLRPGDMMEGTITGLGTQRNRCVAEGPADAAKEPVSSRLP